MNKTYRTSYPTFFEFNVPFRQLVMDTCISRDRPLAGSLTLPHDRGNRNPLLLVEEKNNCRELAGIAEQCEASPVPKRGREIEMVRAEHRFQHFLVVASQRFHPGHHTS
jgi:hypothetical protein